jgi:hypothetical protein
VDKTEVKADFEWQMVGNFKEFPALRMSRVENGPGKPFHGGDGHSDNQFESTVFAMADLGIVLESPRDGRWSRYGGDLPVILDILPASAAARAQPKIKRGMRLEKVNGRPIATLGPEGFKRMQSVRPLRLGVCNQPLDYIPGAGKECQNNRPDIYERTMQVDFMRDFGPSAEVKASAKASKQTKFEHTIPWADAKGVPDLERRIARLHPGLRQSAGWPPEAKPRSFGSPDMRNLRPGSKNSKSSPLLTASGSMALASSGSHTPGSPLTRIASPMHLTDMSPNFGFSKGAQHRYV